MPRLSQTLTQKQKLAPRQVLQAKLLQLNTVNLEQTILKELEQNPVLEQIEAEEYDDKSMAEEILEEVDAPVEDMYTDESSYYLDQEKNEMPLPDKNSFIEGMITKVKDLGLSDFEQDIAEEILWNTNERGYLYTDLVLIADNFEFHAEAIVSDLLEAVIEVIEPTLKLNKLEGDAAFFYIESNDSKNQADDIIRIMDKANESFNEKASSLVFVRACGCEPCLESKNLRLKIVAHKGNFAIKKIRNFEELAGEDVIFTHRMLKNGIESNKPLINKYLFIITI